MMKNGEFIYDVYICYSSKDKLAMRELAERLKKDGIQVWFDEWMIKPGDSIIAKISEGLEQSRILVFAMSSNSFGADWVSLEHHTFLFRDPQNTQRRFIPMRLDDSPIKDMLKQFSYIDWRKKSEDEYEKLLSVCRIIEILPSDRKRAISGSSNKTIKIGDKEMARRVFYSFHYKPDNWRAAQVRNIGVIEGNKPVSDNDWETIVNGGDTAIKKWIDDQISGKSCTIVLIGSKTAGRKWIKYEIKKSWDDGKGVLGIYIHNLLDKDGNQSTNGDNPFDDFTITIGDDKKKLSNIIKAYDPPFKTSTYVYDHIKENIENWVEKAVEIRSKY